MKIPIEITSQAFDEIVDIYTHKNIPSNYCLRIGSKGSGCSGVTHYLGFDEQYPDDLLFNYESINVVIKKKDFMHLIGVKLDFINSEEKKGFVFE